MNRHLIDEVLEDIAKITKEEIEKNQPMDQIKDGEIRLGELNRFAKQTFACLQKMINKLEKLTQGETKKELLPELRRLDQKISIVKEIFWGETNEQLEGWKYKEVGIRKGYVGVMIKKSKSDCQSCSGIMVFPFLSFPQNG